MKIRFSDDPLKVFGNRASFDHVRRHVDEMIDVMISSAKAPHDSRMIFAVMTNATLSYMATLMSDHPDKAAELQKVYGEAAQEFADVIKQFTPEMLEKWKAGGREQ